jgi:hypothetical protein
MLYPGRATEPHTKRVAPRKIQGPRVPKKCDTARGSLETHDRNDHRRPTKSIIELRPPGTSPRGAVHPPESSPPQGKTGRMMKEII